MSINYNTLIKNLLPLIIIVLITYGISSFIYIFLPIELHQMENNISNKDSKINYKVYQVFHDSKQHRGENGLEKKQYKLTSNIKLKAIYSMQEKNDGWIIIGEKSSNKTYILGLNDIHKGYKLKEISIDHVLFEKNSTEYKLTLENKKLRR